MTIQDVFQRITSALDQAGIEYMLSGSFAAAFYGTARSTQDIDFVIRATVVNDDLSAVNAIGIAVHNLVKRLRR